jgi:hypothetical protein
MRKVAVPLVRQAVCTGRRAYVLVNNRTEGNAPMTVQGLVEYILMMPGEIERDHDHDEKEPVTNNASNNATPPVAHSSSSPEERVKLNTSMRYGPKCLLISARYYF